MPEAIESCSELRLSMQRLLDVQNHCEDPYYRVEWDAESRNRIIGITTMRAMTTGARKECIQNTFRQAQLLLTETTDDTTTERFIWMPTPPQNPGEPVNISKEYLRGTLEYRPLLPQYIAEEIIERASSPEDYAAVIALMVEAGIPSFSQLHSNLDHLIKVLGVDVRRSVATIGHTEVGASALTEILQVLPEVDFQAAAYLKTRTIGAIATSLKSGNSFAEDPDITAYQDKLVSLMTVLLSDKTIPTSPVLLGRVCGAYPIYRTPLGTALLYNRLKDTYAKSTSKTLFNRPRAALAAGYMAEVLGSVLREGTDIDSELRSVTNEVIRAGAQMSHLKDNEEVNFDVLLSARDFFPQHSFDLTQSSKETQSPVVVPFERVSLAFYSLLENLYGEDKPHQSTRHLNSMRAQNVHMLLTPLIFLEHVRLRRQGGK